MRLKWPRGWQIILPEGIEVMENGKQNVIDRVIPLICFIVGCIALGFSFIKYGFWDDVIGPLSGFYPAIVSGCLICISIPAFFQSFKSVKADMPRDNWLVPLALVLILVCSYFIGMIASLFIFLLLWLKGIEKLSWKLTCSTTVVMTAIVVFVFRMWLQIEFPKGLLFNVLF